LRVAGGGLSGELGVGGEGAAGPVAAGDLGDGEEGTPIVRHAVEGGGGQGRVAGLKGGEVVLGPAGEFAAEDGLDLGVEPVETGGEFGRVAGEEDNDDRTVVKGAGKRTDAGQDGGGEGVEGADGLALPFAAVGTGAAFVSGIEQAAQFLGLGQVRVHFVQEEGGLVLVHEAEEDGGGKVFGAEGPGHQGGEDVEGGGLATAGLRGGEV
jgi:hypothetical protein